MNKHLLPLTLAACFLSACGFKGDLYLPKEGDKARFGVIQTGLGLQPTAAPTTTPSPTPQKDK